MEKISLSKDSHKKEEEYVLMILYWAANNINPLDQVMDSYIQLLRTAEFYITTPSEGNEEY